MFTCAVLVMVFKKRYLTSRDLYHYPISDASKIERVCNEIIQIHLYCTLKIILHYTVTGNVSERNQLFLV